MGNKKSTRLNLHVSEEMKPETCTIRHQAGIVWSRERRAGSGWRWDTDTWTSVCPWKTGSHPKQRNTEVRALLLGTPGKYTASGGKRHTWKGEAHFSGFLMKGTKETGVCGPGSSSDRGSPLNWNYTALPTDHRRITSLHFTVLTEEGALEPESKEATRALPASPQNHM